MVALATILAGVALIFAGIFQLAPSQQATGAGGIIIFIGPIPVFIGSGTPSSLVIVVAAIMSVLTILAVILFRRRY